MKPSNNPAASNSSGENNSTHAAFLRGINVGGNTLISMEGLKTAFSSLGFTNIKTILASGNVTFETSETNRAILSANIERKLQSEFGFKITVTLRTRAEILALVASAP